MLNQWLIFKNIFNIYFEIWSQNTVSATYDGLLAIICSNDFEVIDCSIVRRRPLLPLFAPFLPGACPKGATFLPHFCPLFAPFLPRHFSMCSHFAPFSPPFCPPFAYFLPTFCTLFVPFFPVFTLLIPSLKICLRIF